MLGIIALIYNRDRLAWFLGIFSLLILMLSFGKFFSVIYDLFFNYFPYFNKFRVPVLILYLMPMTFGLLAANGCTFLTGLWSRYKETDVAKLKSDFMAKYYASKGLPLRAFLFGNIARHLHHHRHLLRRGGEHDARARAPAGRCEPRTVTR